MNDAIVEGWYLPARRRQSPNYDARPDPTDISLLVIHNISLPPGEYGGGYIEDFFCNELDCGCHPWFDRLRELKVSAHLLIDRQGRPCQFVPFHLRAWHAGESCFAERGDCNDFSIGVELEGSDNETYTEQQYASLVRLTRVLLRVYPAITPARISGHSDIAPQRKTDPGPAFDWRYYRNQIEQGDSES
ncbi:MAG: 1,6-anhydro-N-acetylmuramyl-L-alanine amidase AmpD [Gammaproteobacteria bacterium]|nr:1,6-anhydro-N-acetylmuramyl-L-alanine amidase AmpD [Gammaproteobacteria bacterium]